MKSPEEIKQLLEHLGNDWPSDSSVTDRVMAQLANTTSSSTRTNNRRKQIMRITAGTAITLFVALMTWWISESNNSTLYAQVQKAMSEAHTIHVIHKGGGPEAKVIIQSWYMKDVGFRVELPDDIRLGNKQHFWLFDKQTKTATRSKSIGLKEALNAHFDVREIAKELDQGFKRFPEADRKIGDQSCKAYLRTDLNTDGYPNSKIKSLRVLVFLDEKSRVARVEYQGLLDKNWVLQSVQEWKYDRSLDKKLFEPDFGDGAMIIDVDRAFEDLVSLKNAKHTEERFGLIYAIHQIERFQGGGVFVMSSVRGTEETLKKFPPEKRMIQPGIYLTDGPATNYDASPQGGGYFRIKLAQANHLGIDAQWWIVVPRGRPLSDFKIEPGKIKINASITPGGGKYADQYKDSRGVIHHKTWDLVLDVPDIRPQPSLKTIAKRVYANVSLLKPVFNKHLDFGLTHLDLGVTEVNGTPTQKHGTTDNTTEAEFTKATEEHLRFWFRGDIEFQLDRSDYKIRLNYIPCADNQLLKRIAKRTNLRSLFLRGTGITDPGLQHLGTLKQLEVLDISETKVTDRGLRHLENLTSLKTLNVTNSSVTAEGIGKLKSVLPNVDIIYQD